LRRLPIVTGAHGAANALATVVAAGVSAITTCSSEACAARRRVGLATAIG